jgi:hypothetical protein
VSTAKTRWPVYSFGQTFRSPILDYPSSQKIRAGEKLSLGLSPTIANPTQNMPISPDTRTNKRTTEAEMVQTLANVGEVPLGSVLKSVITY